MEIIEVDSVKWNETVCSMHSYDFYHKAEYHAMDKSGKPLLLSFKSENEQIALPLILRNIENTDYKDVTSVYGYAGPLQSRATCKTSVLEVFRSELKHFFDENNVVSAFARLHPLFGFQHQILAGLGETALNGSVVWIDLLQTENEQRHQYARSLRNQINRLTNNKLWTISPCKTKDDIAAFTSIYNENMMRVNARSMYFLTAEYFEQFLQDIPSHLWLVYYDSRPVCGSLFTECNEIIQPHLSATATDFLSFSPLKKLWDEIRRYATLKGLRFMNLGGGVGGSNDSLFEFKRQFSHLQLPFCTWRYVHDEKAYLQLAKQSLTSSLKEKSDFFPEYRKTT